MGGGGFISETVTKAKEAVKKTVKAPKTMFEAGKGIVKGEDVGSNIKKFSKGLSNISTGQGGFAPGTAGVAEEAGLSEGIYDPAGSGIGGLAKSFYDKPKAQKKEAAALASETAAAQKEQLAKLKGEEAQQAASKEAADSLARGRRSQRSKNKTGRSGTILTGKLGVSGEETKGRKTLLGA